MNIKIRTNCKNRILDWLFMALFIILASPMIPFVALVIVDEWLLAVIKTYVAFLKDNLNIEFWDNNGI